MVFDSVNIQQELIKERDKQPDILSAVNSLFNTSVEKDSDVLERLAAANLQTRLNIDFDKLDSSKIFSATTIHDICVNYRLRFLDSENFKAEFPYEAIHQINQFEKLHNTKIQSFKIIAPYDMFQLKDVNEDPLLFAQLSDNSFYLLHKWGKDLEWYRGILNFPFRSIYTFFLCTILFAGLVAWSIPFSWLYVSRDSELLFRFWLNTHFTIAFFFFFIFLGSLSNSSFSDTAWNSKYYNQ